MTFPNKPQAPSRPLFPVINDTGVRIPAGPVSTYGIDVATGCSGNGDCNGTD